jgi:hypothetical protein
VVLISLSFGPARENGKAGPATGSGSDVDAVSQDSDRLAHDEEADAETIASRRIKTGECLEHPRHLVPGHTDSGVIHVNTDALVGVTATDENAATGLCVFDGVADQVAQNGPRSSASLSIVALVGTVRTLTPFA